MDLDSRLANLTLAEIASMLNTKQQEVLLASISVAARFIQQLQAEEQQLQAEEQQQQQHHNNNQQQQQQQHHHQQQAAAAAALLGGVTNRHLDRSSSIINNQNNKLNLNLNLNTSNITNQTNTTSQQLHDQDIDDIDDDDDDDDDEVDDRLLEAEEEEQFLESDEQLHHTQDGQVLLTIREFAEELKHRRKSIRLSQKGAAQSLRAFTSGEQPCTDAIIYHFENLQLEPDRAMQLIPLLRDWLDWAEKHRLNGKQLPMMSAVTKVPRERKRKVVLFNEKAKQYLEDAFLRNNHPDRYQLDVISQELNIPTRSIRKWFTNRRQRKRFAEKFSPVS